MSRQLSLIAVPEADKDQSTGVITYWRLSGTVDHSALMKEFHARWYSPTADMLDSPSYLVALKRAFEKTAPPKAIIKPLRDEMGYTALVPYGSEEEAQQRWRSERSVWFERRPKETDPYDKLQTWFREVHEGTDAERMRVLDLYQTELITVHPSDLSGWFVRMVEKLQAVSLRDTGGFYFVPRAAVQKWELFSDIVSSVSDSKIMTIPAMAGEQAALAIITALNDEVALQTQQMQDALEAEKYGKRAISSKIDACNAMLFKIGTYEKLLGQKLEDLAESTQQLRAKFVQAEMVSRSKERDGR